MAKKAQLDLKEIFSRDWVRTTLGVILVLGIYLTFSLQHISDPFFRVNEDTNGTNGIGALNMAEHGFGKMKFGNHLMRVSASESIENSYYTNHPVGFLIPSAVLINIFGQSEAAARWGPLLFMLIGIGFFYVALEKVFDSRQKALFATGIFIVLPATVFYGKHLDMQAPALGMMLISYSLFILYWFRESKSLFYSFLASVLLGVLVSWFYVFMPIAIWFYIKFAPSMREFERRNVLLYVLPALSIVAAGINVLHAYILNGDQAFENYKRSFFLRSARIPFRHWASDFYEVMQNGITGVFLAAATAGAVIYGWKERLEDNNTLLIPVLLAPVLLTIVFKQWVLHPFGQMFYLPAIGVLVLTGVWYAYNRFGISGMYVAILVVIFGLYSSTKYLDAFYSDRVIIAPEDRELIQKLSNNVHDDQVCITDNDLGINMTGILHWYLGHTTSNPGTCLDQDDTIVLLINPELDESTSQRAAVFEDAGFTAQGCAQLYCLMMKPTFAKEYIDISLDK